MKNKLLRYTLGFVVLFVILAAVTISQIALFIVSVPFIICALHEYRQMFDAKKIYPHKIIPELIGIICSYLYIYNHNNYVTPVITGGIVMSFFATIIKNKKPYMLTAYSTIMGFMFISCTLYIVKLFYLFPVNNRAAMILIYFAAVLLGDFSASKIGPLFKDKRLSPEISPNKTTAGALANMLFSCLICSLAVFVTDISVFKTLLLGITISIFSQIGDLSISLIKRDLGIKHSGTLFLSYGGILDRVDSFIFSAPAAYYCLIAITNKFMIFAN